jgi:hypothetical protein
MQEGGSVRAGLHGLRCLLPGAVAEHAASPRHVSSPPQLLGHRHQPISHQEDACSMQNTSAYHSKHYNQYLDTVRNADRIFPEITGSTSPYPIRNIPAPCKSQFHITLVMIFKL